MYEVPPKPKRQITVSLQEGDWKKFLKSHPDPVDWIVRKIQDSIRKSETAAECHDS